MLNDPYDEKGEAEFEEKLLKDVLRPHIKSIATLKTGYELLVLICLVFKFDLPRIDEKLNDYYVQLIRLIQPLYEEIQKEIEDLYYQNSPNDLPSFYMHPDIFDGSFYKPIDNFHEGKKSLDRVKKITSWKDMEEDIYDCMTRIEEAYFRILGDQKSKIRNEKLMIAIKKYINSRGMFLVNNSLVIERGDIHLDPQTAKLQYKNNPPVEVSMDKQEVEFLELLLTSGDKVLPYEDIAKKLKFNSSYVGVTEKALGLEIRYLKRDLTPLLKKAGMEKEAIDKFIVAQRNVGYKVQDT